MKKWKLFLTLILTTSSLLVGCKNTEKESSRPDFVKALTEAQKANSGYSKVKVEHSLDVGSGSKMQSAEFDIFKEKGYYSWSFNNGNQELKSICVGNDIRTISGISPLSPKYFPVGTGVFDGSYSKKTPISSLVELNTNGNFFESLLSYNVYEEETQNPFDFEYGKGFVMITNNSLETNELLFQNGKNLTFDAKNDISVSIAFGAIDGLKGGRLIKNYDVYLVNYNDQKISLKLNSEPITISSPSIENVDINVSEALNNSGYTSFNNARLRIVGLANGLFDYCLIKSVKFSYDETKISASEKEDFDNASFFDRTNDEYLAASKAGVRLADANYIAFSFDNRDKHHWQASETKHSYCPTYICFDFIIDDYKIAFGERLLSVSLSRLQQYIDSGWCHFRGKDPSKPLNENDTFIVEDFVVDDVKCPIKKINSWSSTILPDTGHVLFECVVDFYRYFGYDEMPVFLLYPDTFTLQPSPSASLTVFNASSLYIGKDKFRIIYQERVSDSCYAKAEIVLNNIGWLSSITVKGESNGKSISCYYRFSYK